ncbi:MAG: MarR family transcriptional regulator [Planctomycetaceae bacterium]|nr:MarR family transcriptional regulator [Planctomycetaceae bacterium]
MSSENSEKACQGIGMWIVSTAHAFRRALECELAHQGVTYRQWEVMAWLNSDGEQPQNELADKMGLEAQTLAGILARMERDGWLSRQNCSEDRRRKLIKPTSKAMKIWNEMRSCCDRIKQQAMRGLFDEELRALESICDRIRRNLDTNCQDASQDEKLLLDNCVSNILAPTVPVGEETRVDLEETRF